MAKKKRFTKRENERRALDIVSRMKAEAMPFEDDSDEAREIRIDRATEDRFYFFKTYFPHYFDKPFAEFHNEWDELADVADEPVFIAAPREHAKSVFWTFGIPLHDICCKLKHFILFVSDTEDLAADFAAFVQLELEENPRIKQDFGELQNPGNWQSKDFTTTTGIRVKARGRGQRVRGLRNRQYRVDRIIIDDLENDKNVKNPKLIKETVQWILEALINTLGKGGNMIMVGTILARKSVLATMINMKDEDDPDQLRFISKIYKVYREDGSPLWPDVWPIERIKQKRRTIGFIAFMKDFMNDPKDEKGLFREEWIRYYYPEEILNKALIIATFLDPSMESGASNDYKAIITGGLDTEAGILYVLDAFIRRCSPDQMARTCYSRYEEFHPVAVGGESNALGEFLRIPFQIIAREKGYQLPLREIKHSIAKESRIGRLSPHAERGIIRFQKGHSDQDLLVEQLIYFPSTTVNDDGPDALEGMVEMLERHSLGTVSEGREPEKDWYHAKRKSRLFS